MKMWRFIFIFLFNHTTLHFNLSETNITLASLRGRDSIVSDGLYFERQWNFCNGESGDGEIFVFLI